MAADATALVPTLQQVRDGLLLDVGRRLPAESGGGLRELLADTQRLEPLDDGLLRRRLADHFCFNGRPTRVLSGPNTFEGAQYMNIRIIRVPAGAHVTTPA
jgi:hypothetical protein